MAAKFVTEAELRSALGIGNLYSSAVVEECCQAAENIVKSKLWYNEFPVVAHESTTSVATIYFEVPHAFIVGDTITVAGLLMGEDVIDQLVGQDLGDVIVLPRVMFDHPDGIALDDLAPDQIATALDCPVFLADRMADVWRAATARDADR